MNILIISDTPTHPTIGGNRACILSYAQMLRDMGHSVYFLFSHGSWEQGYNTSISEMKKFWGTHLFFHQQNLLDRIKFAIFHRFFFPFFQYYPLNALFPLTLPPFLKKVLSIKNWDSLLINYWHFSKICDISPSTRNILFTHDIFTDRYSKTGSKWLSTRKMTESTAFSKFDHLISIQEQETTVFRSLTSKPVSTSYSYFPIKSVSHTSYTNLLFLSGPSKINIDSIRWFVAEVFARLHEDRPDVKLLIGGGICAEIQDLSSHPGIQLCGRINDLSCFYSQGAIFVNPTHEGTGLKIKTFEALAFGCAVLCTPHSAIGIFTSEQAPLLIAETASEWLRLISLLLADNTMINNYMKRASPYINAMNSQAQSAFSAALGIDR